MIASEGFPRIMQYTRKLEIRDWTFATAADQFKEICGLFDCTKFINGDQPFNGKALRIIYTYQTA